jgi:hypothetical protein
MYSKSKLLPLLLLAVLIGFLVLRIFFIFSKANDIAGNEQNVIYSIQMFLNEGKLYQSPSSAPFSITQYTPLYYYVCGFTAKLFGLSANDISILYIIGRSWSLIFNLITAMFVFKIGKSILSLPKDKSWVLFVLSFVFTFLHNFAVRSDSMHDMFGIISVFYFLLYYVRRKDGLESPMLLGIAILASAASVFSKQSGIQFIIIFLGFCIFIRDWKTLFKTLMFAITIYGLSLLFFYNKYDSFFENTIGGISNGINIHDFLKFIILKNISIISIWPLIFVTLYLIVKKGLPFKGNTIERLLSICILGTLIFALVTALKMGSTVQYFIVVMNLSLAFVFKHFEARNLLNVQTMPGKLLISYCTLIIMVYAAYNVKYIKSFDFNPALQSQRTAAMKTAEFISKSSGFDDKKYIFVNLTTNYSIPSRQRINNYFFKNCLVPQMDILEYSTGPSKVVGYQKLEALLLSGEVAYLIESTPASPFSIINNISEIRDSKFKLIKNIEGYLIYKFSEDE